VDSTETIIIIQDKIMEGGEVLIKTNGMIMAIIKNYPLHLLIM
jgi:hypothetical protein